MFRLIRNAKKGVRRRKKLIIIDYVSLYAASEEIATIKVSDIVAAKLVSEKSLIQATQRQNLGTKALESPALLAHMTGVEATVYNRRSHMFKVKRIHTYLFRN